MGYFRTTLGLYDARLGETHLQCALLLDLMEASGARQQPRSEGIETLYHNFGLRFATQGARQQPRSEGIETSKLRN
jgi:hypothetical protein